MKKIILITIICAICTEANSQWNLTGNTGTNASTNFIGTTDAKPLKFRTNNGTRMTISSGGKVGIGITAPVGKLHVKGNTNVSQLMIDASLTQTNANPLIRLRNNAGTDLMWIHSDDTTNLFIGLNAGRVNGSSGNTFTGSNAGYSNTSGYWNTANGSYALYSNTSGFQNTSTGMKALYSNTDGYYNTANGLQALYSNTTGDFNTATGDEALYSNTTGDANTATGVWALFWNTGGFGNTATGYRSLEFTTGSYNTAHGTNALHNNQTGINNTANGNDALYYNSTGSYNTAVGMNALYNNTNAARNTAIGISAGASYANSDYNTFVGAYCDANAASFLNSSAMGDAAAITASSQVRLGDGGVNSIGGYAGWTTLPSDGRFKQNIRENVPGIEFISKLRPVTYTLDVHGVNRHVGVKENGKESIYDEKSRIRYTGFIAQEVENAAKETGFDFSGVDAPKNDKDVYGLRYAEFVVPLVKAVQELNEELKLEVRSQKSENEMLKSEIKKLMTALGLPTSDLRPPTSFLLEQNSPNPFNTQTEIRFRLPEKFNSAQLIITDANGKQVRKDVLNSSSSIIIKAAELSAGTYSYSLVIDRVNIETKQMILTK